MFFFIIRIRTLIIGVTVVGYEFGRGGDLEFDRLLSPGFTIALNCYLSLSMLMLTMSPSGGSGGPPQIFFNRVDVISSILVDFGSLILVSGFTMGSIKKIKVGLFDRPLSECLTCLG